MICGFDWKRTIRPIRHIYVIMINHICRQYPFVFEHTHIIIYRDSQTCGIRLECSRQTVYQADFGCNCWILLVGSGGYFVVRPCKVRTTSSPQDHNDGLYQLAWSAIFSATIILRNELGQYSSSNWIYTQYPKKEIKQDVIILEEHRYQSLSQLYTLDQWSAKSLFTKGCCSWMFTPCSDGPIGPWAIGIHRVLAHPQANIWSIPSVTNAKQLN